MIYLINFTKEHLHLAFEISQTQVSRELMRCTDVRKGYKMLITLIIYYNSFSPFNKS